MISLSHRPKKHMSKNNLDFYSNKSLTYLYFIFDWKAPPCYLFSHCCTFCRFTYNQNYLIYTSGWRLTQQQKLLQLQLEERVGVLRVDGVLVVMAENRFVRRCSHYNSHGEDGNKDDLKSQIEKNIVILRKLQRIYIVIQ